jgi:diadenosine tetraphosphate (Ap4A) HIT family hydrolase
MTCVFCCESSEPRTANSFLGEDWPYEGRILSETERVFVIPGYGPQVYPYALIVTRRHFHSLAQATPQERREIIDCLSWLLRSLSLPELFVFEHAGCRNFDSCIDHFHLHVVDVRYDVGKAIEHLGSSAVAVTSELGLQEEGTYLFAARFGKEGVLRGQLARVAEKKDQFFRRAIAAKLGQQDWDWRLGMNRGFMLRLMEETQDIGIHRDSRGATLNLPTTDSTKS